MKKRLFIVGLCTAVCLLAQGPPPRGGGRMGPGGPGPFGRGPGMPGQMRTVTGAPYSAVEVTESTQVLANGNTIQRRTQGNVYRDSMGRVRTESAVEMRGGAGAAQQQLNGTVGAAAGQPRVIVNIHDPVAGVMRTLDTQNRTAHEVAVRPMGRGGNGAPPADRPFGPGRGPRPDAAIRTTPQSDPNTVSVDLPMQTINGVQATGKRVTRTIPAGQIGNAQPIQIVHEVWTAVDLKVPVMVKLSDPRSGTTTTQLTNITRSEPDSSLFQTPADYTVSKGGRGPGGMRGGPGGQIR